MEKQITGLAKTGDFLKNYCERGDRESETEFMEFAASLRRAEVENPWFTQDSILFALKSWANLLTEENIKNWLKSYKLAATPKRLGLILAGNIPAVGFHDVICTVLGGHIPVIKLSSKDKIIIPFLLKKWNDFSENSIHYHIVEKLENYDAVIATGTNNTARYLEYYFKNHQSIIRKNRTSVAVLKGNESSQKLQALSEDIFRYFGLGCRNVSRLFIPVDFPLDRLFENFLAFSGIINHNKYANNYDYNKAVYLLNMEQFWDNNFVMLREDESLFSPLSVLNFTRYNNLYEVKSFLNENSQNIQCIVADPSIGLDSVDFGAAQHPALDTYADNIDTMRFMEVI